MAVTINKSSKAKAKVVAKTKAKPISKLGELIDEYGELKLKLEKQQKELEPLSTAVSKLKVEISESMSKNTAADAKKEVIGHEYTATLGMKANATLVTDKDKAMIMLEGVSEGLALELAKVTLGDLKSYLTPEQLKEVTKMSRTGARPLKIDINY